MAEIKRISNQAIVADQVISTAMERAVASKIDREKAVGKKRIIRNVINYILIFFIVLIVLLQSVSIYSTQKKLTDLDTEIYTMTRENESLKVQIIKATNLNAAKEGAKSKEYVLRSDVEGMKVDLNYNNFRTETTTAVENRNIIDKLFAMFK
ncbi:MAG: hypothetical protein QMB63_07210 [Clostridiaceae bacterium]